MKKPTCKPIDRCRRIKREAQRILWMSEHVGVGQRRPSARRAWNFANKVQNRLIINDQP